MRKLISFLTFGLISCDRMKISIRSGLVRHIEGDGYQMGIMVRSM